MKRTIRETVKRLVGSRVVKAALVKLGVYYKLRYATRVSEEDKKILSNKYWMLPQRYPREDFVVVRKTGHDLHHMKSIAKDLTNDLPSNEYTIRLCWDVVGAKEEPQKAKGEGNAEKLLDEVLDGSLT